MAAEIQNLFADVPKHRLPAELIENLVDSNTVRIERIVSTHHASPPGFWYNQPEREWVLVLKGEAKILFADTPTAIHMRPGDHLTISSHRRHRVEWTSEHEPTIWLAVFFGD